MCPPLLRFFFALVAMYALIVLGPMATMGRAEPVSAEAVPSSDDYVLRVWDMNEGLPRNHIRSIAQTPDGYLWLTTVRGLARFDGVRFTLFSEKVTPGLPINAEEVFVARDGMLWVRMEGGGIARGNGYRFDLISPGNERFSHLVPPAFVEDAAGGIWFTDRDGTRASRWFKGNLSTFSTQAQLGIGNGARLQATPQGTVWSVSPTAVGFLDGARFVTVDQSEAAGGRMTPSGTDAMWVARGRQLLRYRADQPREVVADLSWLGEPDEINCLYEDRAGDVWIGTRRQGLFRFCAGQFVRVPTSHPAVMVIMQDRAENLWVGTQGGGLNRLRRRVFSLRQTEQGLQENRIASVAEDASGRLWIASHGSPPVRAVDEGNHTFSAPPEWFGGMVFALCADPSEGMWLGGSRGLLRWQDGVYHRVLATQATGVLLDRRGVVWAAAIRGPLSYYRNGVTHTLPTTGGLENPRALAEDSQGRIWVGTEGGQVFQRATATDPFATVPLPGENAENPIRFIVPDAKDTVWIGANNGGLYRWRAGRIAQLPQDSGFPLDDPRSLAVGPDGNLWIGTERGLFCVARSALETALDDQTRWLHPVLFGSNDGLPSIEFDYGFRNAVTRTRDGHLWFATLRGALEVKLEAIHPTPAPPVRIEEFQIGKKSTALLGNEHPECPPRTGPIRIRYTLPNLGEPERVRFRHRLIGLGDAEWDFAGDQRVATFSYLPAGDYRFEVQATQGDGLWLPTTASLAFTVRAAWWETIAFRSGATVAGLLALAWTVRVLALRRVRARMQRLEHENALERERARIARDMHDELGARLTRIALMGELAAAEPAMVGAANERFMKVAQAARDVSGTLDRIVWTINPNNDTLERLVGYLDEFAREYLEATGLSLHSELPAQLPSVTVPSDTRHQLLLSFKEALNNIAKHADAHTVSLRIISEPNHLTIKLTDDGKGFDSKTVSPSANGLVNLQKRLEALGGVARIESGPGAGTTVTFTVPLP